jgi:hypothetical protein
VKDIFEHGWARIRDASTLYGSTSVPGSLVWTINPLDDESLTTSVYRLGKGLKVRFRHKDLKGLPMDKWPAVFTTDLLNDPGDFGAHLEPLLVTDGFYCYTRDTV